jgi:RNA polymerase sigma-70 factor (ECF subfamily)
MLGETTYFGTLTGAQDANKVITVPPRLAGHTEFVAAESCAANPSQGLEASDELLLKQVHDGEKEALALLFRRHSRSVRNVAYRILRNESEADDLVQEVFLFIFRKAALFDSTHWGARSWIIHVTYHRAFDRRRYLNSRHF